MNEWLGKLVAEQQTVMAAQQKLIVELQERLLEREGRSAALEAQVRRLERELIGPKTERTKVPPAERDLGGDEPSEEDALARRAAVATEEVTHKVAEDSKHCPKCSGTRFGALGFETSTTFEYVPGRFVRRVHRREKLACSCGECILVAPAPPKLVPGGQYGFGFAAFLVVEKCADSIPIYRIEKRFERLGIPLSRATMNDIFHAAAERVAPLVARLTTRIAAVEIVLADETSMRLQDRRSGALSGCSTDATRRAAASSCSTSLPPTGAGTRRRGSLAAPAARSSSTAIRATTP